MTYYAVYLEHEPNGRPAALFMDKQQAIEWAYAHALIYVSVVPIRLAGIHPPTQPDFSTAEWDKKMVTQ